MKLLGFVAPVVLLCALRLHGSPLEDAEDAWQEQETTLAAMQEHAGAKAKHGAAECSMIMFGNAMLPKRTCSKGNTGSCVTTVLPSKSGGDDLIVSNCDESGVCTGMGGLIEPIEDGHCVTQPGTDQRIYCSKEQPPEGKIPAGVQCPHVKPKAPAPPTAEEEKENHIKAEESKKDAEHRANADAEERGAKASSMADQDEKEMKAVKERSAKFQAKLKSEEGTHKIAKEVDTKKAHKTGTSTKIHLEHAGAAQLGLSAGLVLVPALAAAAARA